MPTEGDSRTISAGPGAAFLPLDVGKGAAALGGHTMKK